MRKFRVEYGRTSYVLSAVTFQSAAWYVEMDDENAMPFQVVDIASGEVLTVVARCANCMMDIWLDDNYVITGQGLFEHVDCQNDASRAWAEHEAWANAHAEEDQLF